MTPGADDQSGRWLDAQLHLLDRQVLDVDGVPIAVVDDLELSEVPFGQEIPIGTPPPVITALLSGAAIATRLSWRTPTRVTHATHAVGRRCRDRRGDQVGRQAGTPWISPGPSGGSGTTSSDASREAATFPGGSRTTIPRTTSEVDRDHHGSARLACIRPGLPWFCDRCAVLPRG